MQTASCPSCASLIVFRHAAAVTVVCSACSSAVYRQGMDLQALGKVSSVERDLSPLQLGATGSFHDAAFTVVGVLRKGRRGVRWNEWFIEFGDGRTGWLAEGNAELQVFVAQALSVGLPDPRELPAGARVEIGRTSWTVMESAEARVLAAEGQLPFRVAPDELFHYCDLKDPVGRAATLDRSEAGEVLLWTGEVVDLRSLGMEGLRPFTGWTDPVFMGYRGPEVESVRALSCPSCAAPIELRAPGVTARVACSYCGSELGTSEQGGGIALAVIEASSRPPFSPTLPLGSFGTLRGQRWQVIGAMVRSVREDGIDWTWTEFLLHNPYHGFAWLVEDSGGHWSYVRKLSVAPPSTRRLATLDGRRYRSYSRGQARVRSVLGEFYWEVCSGDQAVTQDYVAPPLMLSMERAEREVSWSLGVWMEPEEIRAAFRLDGILGSTGIAPHQPNPYQRPAVRRLATFGFLALLACFAAVTVAAAVLLPTRTLATETWITRPELENVFVSEPFVIPHSVRRDVSLHVKTSVTPEQGTVHVALLQPQAGKAHLTRLRARSEGTVRLDGVVPRPSPGPSLVRVEIASAPGGEAFLENDLVELEVKLRKRWAPAALLALALLAAVWAFRSIAAGFYESKRWQNSEFGPGWEEELGEMSLAGLG